MSDDYRDPLAAALSRIEALERENAALKNMQSGRPATAAELEAVRLENELFRVDTQWGEAMRRKYGTPVLANEKRADPVASRKRRRVAVAVGVALAFPILAVLLMGGPMSIVLGAVGGVVAAFALITFVIQNRVEHWIQPQLVRDRALLAKAREPIVQRLAALRGETLPEEGELFAPVRIAMSDEPSPLEVEANDAGDGPAGATAKLR